MIDYTRFDNIQSYVDDILSLLNELPPEYDAVQYIKSYCDHIEHELSALEDDMPDLVLMIPDNLSAGEADSLRDAVNDWRVKNGYPRM